MSAEPSPPAATGPAATGPAATGPAATGPAATGPAATGPAATEAKPAVSRYATAFGRFWWEFLIGDTPELFVGMLVVLGLAAGLADLGGVSAVVVMPLAVIALLAASVARGRKP